MPGSSSTSESKRKRVALSPHRQQIQRWVEEGNSDEWIASALGTTRSSVQSFRSRCGIYRTEAHDRRYREPVTSSATRGPDAPEGNSYGSHAYEGVLDQGEEGYGLWLDPSVADDPIFREGFEGVSDVRVSIEDGRIVLEPASEGSASSSPLADISAQASQAAEKTSAPEPDAPRSGLAEFAAGLANKPGRVKFFDDAKGYGFITLPEGGELFFHRSEIKDTDSLESGEFVLYEHGESKRGPLARAVRPAG